MCSQTVFVIYFVLSFVFVFVFLLARSRLLIILIKCFKGLQNSPFRVLSKCICHCLCICLRGCLFVGQVMFSHDPHQFCKVSVWSVRPEGFESNTANMQNSQ